MRQETSLNTGNAQKYACFCEGNNPIFDKPGSGRDVFVTNNIPS